MSTIFRYVVFLLGCIPMISDANSPFDPMCAEELRMRKGLPHFFNKLRKGETVRIAYLGGSITRADGWRVKSFAWFKEQYPETHFIEVNAAVSGTGADFGACRLEEAVLEHQTDLVFVEYRVNGGGAYPDEAFEGVVRRIREANDTTDICFVYTIGDWMLPALSQGKQAYYGVMLEEIANHYGIPSIDFGLEVVRLLDSKQLLINVSQCPEDRIWFSKDSCHPTNEGHELYQKVLQRSMQKMSALPVRPLHHALPPALHPKVFNQAKFLPVLSARYSSGWKPVDTEKDPIFTSDVSRTSAILGEAIQCTEVGESLTIDWEGRFLCLTHIPQKTGIEVEVSVDGQDSEVFQFDQAPGSTLFARFFYLKEQAPGRHTAKLTVTKLPEGLVYIAGQCMQFSSE